MPYRTIGAWSMVVAMVMERSRWMPRMYERQNLPSCCCGLSIGTRLVRHLRGP